MPVATTVRVNEAQIAETLRTLNCELSNEQSALIYCNEREILGGGGERAGKSFVAGKYLSTRFWTGDLFWIAGLDYDRCHAEFEYTLQDMQALDLVDNDSVHMPQHAQWTMQLKTGAIIKTWSLQDWLKVGSEAPDGIIVCEIAQISQQQYNRLTDRTAEKRGWLCGTGTFETSLGWYPEKWKLYQLPAQSGKSFSLPSWSNLRVYPQGINDPEIIRLKTQYASQPDYFNERFGGIPCPPHGLVFPEFRNAIHVREMSILDAPVYLWIDPGYDGAYAVEVVQITADTVNVVDEIYERGLVTEQIIDVCMQRPWWRLVAGGAVDIAARQHQAMPAVAEVWQSKAKLSLTSNRVEEAQGRDRLHTFLTVNPIDHQPRLFIAPHCKGVLSEFGACPNPHTGTAEVYRWKEDRQGNVIGSAPDDRNNHGIKAIIYGLIAKFGYVTRSSGPNIIKVIHM
jgi:hypothetical protein